jgi:hypothetical protein
MAMTGPEHYRHAEHLAEYAQQLTGNEDPAAGPMAVLAQMHATLASSAAVIGAHLGLTFSAEEAWREAIGLTRPGRRQVIEGAAADDEPT